MGESVQKPLSTNNPMIIDYATNGMRTDFLDIFRSSLLFCISTGLDMMAFQQYSEDL